MDYIFFCKNFFSATNIPVCLLDKGTAIYSSMSELLSLPISYHRENFDAYPGQNPRFCGDTLDIEYGRIHIENSDLDVFIGPAFSVPVTNRVIHEYMKESAVPSHLREQTVELLYSIPRISHMQFANYLVFLHYCLNNKKIDIKYLLDEDIISKQSRISRYTKNYIENRQEESTHNSYYFELEMYQRIKAGDVNKLKDFFPPDI